MLFCVLDYVFHARGNNAYYVYILLRLCRRAHPEPKEINHLSRVARIFSARVETAIHKKLGCYELQFCRRRCRARASKCVVNLFIFVRRI